MLSGTENRKSGAGRELRLPSTGFCGFHACVQSLTVGGRQAPT